MILNFFRVQQENCVLKRYSREGIILAISIPDALGIEILSLIAVRSDQSENDRPSWK
jgi:hypothetical protein